MAHKTLASASYNEVNITTMEPVKILYYPWYADPDT